jgi:hypothetical protein
MQRTTKARDSSLPVSIPQQERHWICGICIRSIWYEDGCDRAGSSKRASLNLFPAAVDSGNQTDVDPQSPQPAANKPRNTSHWQHSFGKTSGGRHPRKHTKLIQLSTGKSNRSQEQNHRRRHCYVISNLKPKPNKSQNSTAKLRTETETQEKPAQIWTDL